MKHSIMLILILGLRGLLSAQDFPAIGKPCPAFEVSNVINFTKTVATNNDFKGKWLIISFWGTTCSASVNAMPVIEKIRDEFPDKVECLRIGEDSQRARQLYEKYTKLYNLKAPAAFENSLREKFGVYYAMHHIVLNPQGVVIAITYRVTRDNMMDFINDVPLNLPRSLDVNEVTQQQRVDYNKLLLMDGNGGADSVFIQRSIIAPWNKDMGVARMDFIEKSAIINNRFQVVGASLEWLYRLAYGDTTFSFPTTIPEDVTSYGNLSRTAIIEVADTKPFEVNFETGQGLYDYSLAAPSGKINAAYKVKAIMQRDLQNTFDYGVRVEKRKLPCYRLVATRQARKKLKTRSSERMADYTLDRVVLKNQPVKMLIPALINNIQYGPPVIDRTRIKGNIDITLDAVIVDQQDLERGLKEAGLSLRLARKRMRVIVIRDKAKTKKAGNEVVPRRQSQACTV